MAYLKGGSVVDGNLYVEGGLVVRNITTSAGGQLPTLDMDSAQSDHIVKFINDKGALFYTQLGESADRNYIFTDKDSFTFKVNGNGSESIEALNIKKSSSTVEFTLNTSSKNIIVNDSTIYRENKIEVEEGFIDKILPGDINKDSTSGEKISIPESFKYSKE